MQQEVFTNKNVKFYFDKDTQIFSAVFQGLVNMNNILEAFDYVIKKGSSIPTKIVLSDLTALKGTFTMLLDYMQNNLYPYLASKGVVANALIINPSLDPFVKFSVRKLSKLDLGVEIEVFEDKESADKWIDEILNR